MVLLFAKHGFTKDRAAGRETLNVQRRTLNAHGLGLQVSGAVLITSAFSVKS
jgi:hypothetical protein